MLLIIFIPITHLEPDVYVFSTLYLIPIIIISQKKNAFELKEEKKREMMPYCTQNQVYIA